MMNIGGVTGTGAAAILPAHLPVGPRGRAGSGEARAMRKDCILSEPDWFTAVATPWVVLAITTELIMPMSARPNKAVRSRPICNRMDCRDMPVWFIVRFLRRGW